MVLIRVFAVLAPLLSLASAQSWPFGPFTTEGRFIKNALGETVTLVGANWPGAADTMAPEGLQYSSIANIVSKIKSMGMNAIRLTYAIQMIDEYFENGQVDIPFKTSMTRALGVTNGTAIFNQIVAHNPQFNAQTTRLELFDAVAAECFKQEIYVHLDNHVSEAIWCCSDTDGNAWFGDVFFNVANWTRGLSFMAKRGETWGNMMTMSLRNELRSPDNNPAILPTYNWETWYANMMPAAADINAANSGVLIFLSGLNFDTTLAPITTGANLGSGTVFSKSDFSFANKLVLEIHNYETTTTNCASLEAELQTDGFNGMDTTNTAVKNIFPVVMTEWGHAQDAADYATTYQSCLASFFEGLQASWMVWVLAGSYYIRQGIQDYDETWGLLNHQWTAFRDTTNVNGNIIPMVKGTLA